MFHGRQSDREGRHGEPRRKTLIGIPQVFASTPARATPQLPQRLSYSKAAQRTPDDMDRKQRECDERLITLEKTSKAYDCKFEEISRDQKSLNLVMYNIPEEGERAKTRLEAIKTAAKGFDTAVEIALNMMDGEYDEEGLRRVMPTTVERIGQLIADHTKPRPVRLVFNTLL